MSTEQRKAILVIKNYLNKDLTDDYILENYDLAIEQLINNAAKLENIKTPGVNSMSEGNQSITFDGDPWTITGDVKALLPTPYVRMW
ncbi:hypothetical protein VT91_09300 [Clostridium sporogenes]|uniref:hypothetical protein n=1 Tax=Clostridium botulinum TaxID=1491 RepID=UPI000717A4BA|nr:hypothetical protein [Clostridium botulinum]KRU29316.1 hypothetical protein WG71_15590 [Clostridium sporogenes]KRU33404.1 hypothetical protein VT91_09300 [Clostridium sporogenes]KRU33964.1 hypothetical protein VT28_05200 [Clostridium sporogenes]KRU43388.1 hypothetical protein VT95_16530 [Clostridium sporogenes]MBZ1330961.1 hypothetical protein [Clostridium botulinum]